MNFLDLQKKVFAAYFAGSYGEALEASLEALERYPEFFHRSSFWAACLYCRTGEPGRSMSILQDLNCSGRQPHTYAADNTFGSGLSYLTYYGNDTGIVRRTIQVS